MEIVLHHYPMSPFAELARVAHGLKDLDYRSVIIPSIMPKPGLVALTGGYARTPVLQIGADLYCDTAKIIDALEAHTPRPSLYPAPLGDLHRMLAGWAGAAQFTAHVGAALGSLPPGALPQAFIDDRKARFGLDMASLARATPHLASQAVTAATWLDAVLADGRAFVGGDAAGHADLAFYSNLWFVRGRAAGTPAEQAIAALPNLSAWYDRVAAFGHGRPVEASADDALALARAATPDLGEDVDASSGFTAGQRVKVRTDGSGDAPVEGQLLRLSPRGIAVVRDLDGGGHVVVNFPRLGQMVLPA
ncbi:glutathione S-transferase family protein [Glacieibacterium frigidum]|uniref:Glutathione S-transferase family protein n=1 Tax=Glacieibacterium frigidum TaxID=2593303 RepID=A0A552U9B8_9SPHN|nr:glutathione S-transferase family protein [Glacieibacterium frigidum]TRW14816.1 glutathione S-transferase family protein [Glacieibacterium frigidum]